MIDDGGHSIVKPMVTFVILLDHISEKGVYLYEDMHTFYWPEFGVGYKRRGTFIKKIKKILIIKILIIPGKIHLK